MGHEKLDASIAVARDPDPGFGPPIPLVCLACDGNLQYDGPNTSGTLVFIECRDCGMTYTVGSSDKPRE